MTEILDVRNTIRNHIFIYSTSPIFVLLEQKRNCFLGGFCAFRPASTRISLYWTASYYGLDSPATLKTPSLEPPSCSRPHPYLFGEAEPI
jgi:hypothetical protein